MEIITPEELQFYALVNDEVVLETAHETRTITRCKNGYGISIAKDIGKKYIFMNKAVANEHIGKLLRGVKSITLVRNE